MAKTGLVKERKLTAAIRGIEIGYLNVKHSLVCSNIYEHDTSTDTSRAMSIIGENAEVISSTVERDDGPESAEPCHKERLV